MKIDQPSDYTPSQLIAYGFSMGVAFVAVLWLSLPFVPQLLKDLSWN